MNYTDEQYAMLERFEPGLNIDKLTEDELPIYWFLMEQRLLQPRHDIEDGLHRLTEHGKRVLADHRESLKLLQKEAEKDAKQEKQQRFENKISVANLLISLISFFVGISAEFYIGIYSRVVEWWPTVEAWFLDLFS